MLTLFNNFPELRLMPFWRVPKNIINVMSVVYGGACMNVICIFTLGGEEACVCIVILSKLVEDGNSGEKNC